MMYPYYYHDGFYGLGVFGIVLCVLFWVLIFALIFGLLRRSTWGGRRRRFYDDQDSSEDALKILNERYAKGEINKEEYEQKKKDIRP